MGARYFRSLAAALVFTAIAIAGAAMPAMGRESGPVELHPIVPWHLNVGTERCLLSRAFGRKDKPTILQIRRFTPFDTMSLQISVFSRQYPIDDATPRVRLNPDKTYKQIDMPLFVHLGDGLKGVMFNLFELPLSRGKDAAAATRRDKRIPVAERDAREKAIKSLYVGKMFNHDLVLDLPNFHLAMQALRDCADTLPNNWGIDTQANSHLSRRVKPKNLQSWVEKVEQAYPSTAIRENQQAEIFLRLMVSPEGLPTDCVAQMEVGIHDFASTACAILMKNARFEPALNANGKPVKSFFTQSIGYRLN